MLRLPFNMSQLVHQILEWIDRNQVNDIAGWIEDSVVSQAIKEHRARMYYFLAGNILYQGAARNAVSRVLGPDYSYQLSEESFLAYARAIRRSETIPGILDFEGGKLKAFFIPGIDKDTKPHLSGEFLQFFGLEGSRLFIRAFEIHREQFEGYRGKTEFLKVFLLYKLIPEMQRLNQEENSRSEARTAPVFSEELIQEWVQDHSGSANVVASDGAIFNFRYTTDGPDRSILVYHLGTEVGYAHWKTIDRIATMDVSHGDFKTMTQTEDAIRVRPDYREKYKGIGSVLLGLAMRIEREKKTKRFDAALVGSARGFYERLHFRKILIERPRYVFDLSGNQPLPAVQITSKISPEQVSLTKSRAEARQTKQETAEEKIEKKLIDAKAKIWPPVIPSKRLIQIWNSANKEEREVMLKEQWGEILGSSSTDDFLLYVLFDSNFRFRQKAVELNNWSDQKTPYWGAQPRGPWANQIKPELILQHMSEPWKLIKRYGEPVMTDSIPFSEKHAIRNVRMSLLLLILERTRNKPKDLAYWGEEGKRQASYVSLIQKFFEEEFEREIAEWESDFDKHYADLKVRLEKDPDLILSEKRPMTLGEVFITEVMRHEWKRYVLKKNDPYDGAHDNLFPNDRRLFPLINKVRDTNRSEARFNKIDNNMNQGGRVSSTVSRDEARSSGSKNSEVFESLYSAAKELHQALIAVKYRNSGRFNRILHAHDMNFHHEDFQFIKILFANDGHQFLEDMRLAVDSDRPKTILLFSTLQRMIVVDKFVEQAIKLTKELESPVLETVFKKYEEARALFNQALGHSVLALVNVPGNEELQKYFLARSEVRDNSQSKIDNNKSAQVSSTQLRDEARVNKVNGQNFNLEMFEKDAVSNLMASVENFDLDNKTVPQIKSVFQSTINAAQTAGQKIFYGNKLPASDSQAAAFIGNGLAFIDGSPALINAFLELFGTVVVLAPNKLDQKLARSIKLKKGQKLIIATKLDQAQADLLGYQAYAFLSASDSKSLIEKWASVTTFSDEQIHNMMNALGDIAHQIRANLMTAYAA